MRIIPSILEKNWLEAERKIGVIKDLVTWIQIDVVDGFFLPEKTFELELVKKVFEENGSNLLDIHLMVKEPIKWINKCEFVGASRIIGQVEMMSDREEFVKRVKEAGTEAGLAFDVETKVEDIPEETDMVLLMGRKAGFGVRSFEEKVWEKIEILNSLKGPMAVQDDREGGFEIGVDGGVNLEKIKRLKETGVGLAYCGRAIFEEGKVEDNLKNLQR